MRVGEDITITVGGEAIVLRPSLRHAMRLERREGSFAGLVQAITEDSLTAAVEIIRPHYDHPALKPRVFDALATLRGPLLAYVMACAGLDDEKPEADASKKSGKTQSFGAYLTGLFEIGTGWLGWPPAVTLDATPMEITLAYEGRRDMLKALFGASEDEEPKPQDRGSLDDKFKAAFAGVGTTIVRRAA